MIALLLVCLFIDVLITYYFFKQAFVVRSNMSSRYKPAFVMMLAVILATVLLKGSSLSLACLIAGIPAGLATFFAIAMAVAFLTHKGPWN